MAEDIHQPHNMMVRAVLSDVAEAASFLQRYLPQEVSQALHWATLTLREGSFVDEDLRASEADFLYEIAHGSSADPVWIYVLLEHQSTPDRWMRFRLLKYCCRIWDMSFREYPDQRELRAIVPLVFYQGERSWSYSREFADLFAEAVREWPGVPRFAHGLIDQSGLHPEEVQGTLTTQLMQLLLLAASQPGGGLDGRGGTTAGHTGLASPSRWHQLCAGIRVVHPRDPGPDGSPGVLGRVLSQSGFFESWGVCNSLNS